MNGPDGKWVGLGLGDVSPEIATFRAFLLRKFQWVRDWPVSLGASQEFDAVLVDVVMELQRRYGLPASGILNYALKVKSGFIKPAQTAKPTLITLQGTGVDMWTGPPADTARAVQDVAYFQPVAYPATPFPMWPSIQQGRAEVVRLLTDVHPAGDIWIAGYSQGAVIASLIYQLDMLPAGGALHHRLGDLKKVVTWGNPCRQRGVANGNLREGIPVPTGRGIMETQYRLKDTPDWWLDFAHGANSRFGRDLYTDTPDDDEGDWEEFICRIVMGNNIMGGVNGALSQVLEWSTRPVAETIAIFKAIVTAGGFFGGGTGPHVNYSIAPAIDYLRN